MTKTTTTLLISLLVACGRGDKTSKKHDDKPQQAPAVVTRTSVRDVAVAQSHVCAVLSTGQVACWGELHGALEPLTTKPEVIPGVAGATAISETDCVLRGDKPAVCWDHERVVVDVPGTEGAKKIISRAWEPCFLLASGSVTCWDKHEKKSAPIRGLPKLRAIDNRSWGADEWCYVTEAGAVGCSGADVDESRKTLPRYSDSVDIVRTEQDTVCVLR